MLCAIGRMGSGSDAGTPRTQSISSERVSAQTASSDAPRSFSARARADRRVPPHSGQVSSFRNFSTRFMPFSSLTLFKAFSTVAVAL